MAFAQCDAAKLCQAVKGVWLVLFPAENRCTHSVALNKDLVKLILLNRNWSYKYRFFGAKMNSNVFFPSRNRDQGGGGRMRTPRVRHPNGTGGHHLHTPKGT